RWHYRTAREADKFRERVCRLGNGDDEQVELNFASALFARKKAALASAQIELAPRLVHEQRPTVRADEKRNRNRRAVRREKRRDLAVDHPVELVAPVELIRALAQAEHWRIGVKRN